MEGLKTKAAEIGTAVNYETRGSYEIGNISARKTLHRSPHAITKGGRNKGRRYTSTYAPGEYRITKAGV